MEAGASALLLLVVDSRYANDRDLNILGMFTGKVNFVLVVLLEK